MKHINYGTSQENFLFDQSLNKEDKSPPSPSKEEKSVQKNSLSGSAY